MKLLAHILTGCLSSLFLQTLPIDAFVAPKHTCNIRPAVLSDTKHANYMANVNPVGTILFAEGNDSDQKKNKSNLDKGLRTKLVSESIAPWRTVRLFFYGALGSGALVGGLVTLSGAAAALAAARTDVDWNTEILNLAIDFGAVAVFAYLWTWDSGKQKELNQNVEEKMQRKKEQKQVAAEMRQREQSLGNLQLNVQISNDGATRAASIRELQAGAKQHMIVVIGPKKACKDALVGANLLKMDFAMSNVLVVPFETDASSDAMTPNGGFAEMPIYERQPYVARPTGDGWSDYATAELNDAVAQNGPQAKTEGIAVVVANNGKVMRRGVGKVPWRQMVEQLDEASTKEKSNSLF